MISWKIYQGGTLEEKIYLDVMEQSFPNLPPRHYARAFHIAILDEQKIIGGVTLEKMDSLSDDTDVSAHWDILVDRPATRILRFWCSRFALVPLVFRSIQLSVERTTFLYGILSLPLEFAIQRKEIFKFHTASLDPKNPIDRCKWESQAEPTSDGRLLLGAYLRVGARFLGQASGCPIDKSVRIVVGAECKDIDLSPVSRKNATAFV